MLALAQKLHDEYVRNGEQTRDRIVNEARDHAGRLVREAEDKQPIPSIGWFARCRDTEGNEFSLFQADESVPAPGES